MVTRVRKIFFVVIICFLALTANFWKDVKQVFGEVMSKSGNVSIKIVKGFR